MTLRDLAPWLPTAKGKPEGRVPEVWGDDLLIPKKLEAQRSLGSHPATVVDSIQRPIGFQEQLLGSLHAETLDGFMQRSPRHAAEALFEFSPRDMQFCRHMAQRFCSMFADELRRKIDVAVFQ